MAFLRKIVNKLPFVEKEGTIIIREIHPEENRIKVNRNITVKELKDKIVNFFKDTKKIKLNDEDIKNMQLITSETDVGIDTELLKDTEKIDKIWNNAITTTPKIDVVFTKCDTNCDSLKSICKSQQIRDFLKLKEKSPHHLSDICKDNIDTINVENNLSGGKKRKKRKQTKRRRRKKTRKRK